jgi:hypothetical protein
LISLGQHDRIVRVLARQDAGYREPVREDRRHVLAAVDREIDFAIEQRVLDLLDEKPLAAGFGKRRLLQAVARGLDDDDLARRSAGRVEQPAGCRACRVVWSVNWSSGRFVAS